MPVEAKERERRVVMMRPAGLAFEERRCININSTHPDPPPWPPILLWHFLLSCSHSALFLKFHPYFLRLCHWTCTGIKHNLLCFSQQMQPEIWRHPLNILCLMTEPRWQAPQKGDAFSYVPKDNWICNEITSILIHIWILWFHIPHSFSSLFHSTSHF